MNDNKFLHKLLKNTENYYIVLESVLNKEKGYYDLKVDKLVKIIDSILDKQKRPYTDGIARLLLQRNISQKERIDYQKILIEALQGDLKMAIEKLNKERKEKENLYNKKFWQKLF